MNENFKPHLFVVREWGKPWLQSRDSEMPQGILWGRNEHGRGTSGERLRAFEHVMVAVLAIALSMLFLLRRESPALPTWCERS